MQNYLISVSDKDLKKHHDYPRIIQPGEALIWNGRHDPDPCTCLGILGEDKRWYYITSSSELLRVLSLLVAGMDSSAEVKVQQVSLSNLPENLREAVKQLEVHFSSLEKRTQ